MRRDGTRSREAGRRRFRAAVLTTVVALLAVLLPAAAPPPTNDTAGERYGRWRAYSTEAFRTLGDMRVSRGRMTFAKGVSLDLDPGGRVVRISGSRRIARGMCGTPSPAYVLLEDGPADAEVAVLRVTFLSGPPGPDPDFRPNACIRHSYVRARRAQPIAHDPT